MLTEFKVRCIQTAIKTVDSANWRVVDVVSCREAKLKNIARTYAVDNLFELSGIYCDVRLHIQETDAVQTKLLNDATAADKQAVELWLSSPKEFLVVCNEETVVFKTFPTIDFD